MYIEKTMIGIYISIALLPERYLSYRLLKKSPQGFSIDNPASF